MERHTLEVADIFRSHGPAWRKTQSAHLSLPQLKVISAIEQCRSAALGGHQRYPNRPLGGNSQLRDQSTRLLGTFS